MLPDVGAPGKAFPSVPAVRLFTVCRGWIKGRKTALGGEAPFAPVQQREVSATTAALLHQVFSACPGLAPEPSQAPFCPKPWSGISGF